MIKDNANIAGIYGNRPEFARMEEIIRLSNGNPKPEYFKEYYEECFGAWVTDGHLKLLDKMKSYYA